MVKVLNVKETALYLGRSVNNTLAMLHSGALPAIREDKRWMVSKDALDVWLIRESERQAKQRQDENSYEV